MNQIRRFVRKFSVSSDALPFKSIPGPKGIFGIGNFYNYFKPFGKYDFDCLHANGMSKYEDFGPIVCERMIPGVSVVWLYDPDDIAQVFNEGPGDYPRRRSHLALEKYRKDRPEVYRTSGLLPTNGEEWWKIRSKFQKGLSLPKNVRNFLPHGDEIVQDFFRLLPQRFDADHQIEDFLDELSRLNLELICRLTFDERLNSFSAEAYHEDSRSSKLMAAADEANRNTLPTDQGFQLWRFIETADYRKVRQSQEFIEKVAIDLVEKKLKNLDSDGDSLLDQYLKDPNLEVKDLYGMASDMLLAGVHTSAFTTSFMLYHIAHDQRIQDLLYEEALKVLPNENDSLTAAVMNSEVPYARAVLKETFRLNPISIGVGRITNKDMILSGYQIPKDTIVVTQNMVSCRLEKNFSNPLKFIPERWLRSNDNKLDVHPHLVLPFGHGMRACIARRFAEQKILLFLLRFMRIYKIEWKGCTEPLDVVTKLINQPKSKISLKFIKR